MSNRWSVVLAASCFVAAFAVAISPQGNAGSLAKQKKIAPRQDQYGEELPEHALFRIGTTRLRDSGVPQALAFTPNNAKLISIDVSSGIHVWDADSGKEVHGLGQLAVGSPPFAVAPDGSVAAIVETAESCRIYDTSTAKAMQTLTTSWSLVRHLCISADKKLLAAASEDHKVSIWDIASGKTLRQWDCKASERNVCMSFSPNGNTLALGSRGNPTYLWDVATGNERTLGGDEGGCGALAFSLDGKLLAAISADWRHFSLWDLANNKRLHTFPFATDSYWCVAFLPDGKTVATGNYPGKIWFWDIETGKSKRVISGHPGEIETLTFTSDGKRLAAASGGCTVRIWDATSGKELQVFSGHSATLSSLRYTSDGAGITSICQPWYGGSTLRTWDAATGKVLSQRDVDAKKIMSSVVIDKADENWDPPKVTGLWLTSEGPVVAIAGPDAKLRVQNLLTGKVGPALDISEEAFESLQLSDDGRFLVVNIWHRPLPPNPPALPVFAEYGRHSLTVYEVSTGKKHFTETGKDREQFTCRFTADGRHLSVHSITSAAVEVNMQALFGVGGQPQNRPLIPNLYFLDVRSSQKATRVGPRLNLSSLPTLSPSGRLMAIQEDDGESISVMELATGKVVSRHRAEAGRVSSVAFTADGRTLATGTELGKVILWNPGIEKPLVAFPGNGHGIQSLSFSPDGKRLASGGRSTTVIVWDVTRWTERTVSPTALGAIGVAKCWNELADSEPVVAYSAINRLLQSPKDTIDLLLTHLKPVGPDVLKNAAGWIAALDSPRFIEREQASAALQKLGFHAQPALQKALEGKPTLELSRRVEILLAKLENHQLAGESLQTIRALEILETLATPDAIDLLESLTNGDPDAWLTEEAAWALKRARKREPSRK